MRRGGRVCPCAGVGNQCRFVGSGQEPECRGDREAEVSLDELDSRIAVSSSERLGRLHKGSVTIEIKKIVVPYDFWKRCRAAATHAAALAQQFHAPLNLLHVISFSSFEYRAFEGGSYVGTVWPSPGPE